MPPNNSSKESNSDEKEDIHIRAFTTSTSQTPDPITFDTDGVPFIIDNSATGAICNDRSLFVGQFSTKNVAIKTADGVSTKRRLVGILNLELQDDNGVKISYHVPEVVYDPHYLY